MSNRVPVVILWAGLLGAAIPGKQVLSAESITPPPTAAEALTRPLTRLKQQLERQELTMGSKVYLRIFKLPERLELWIESRGRFRLFKGYPICCYAGFLGPKLAEGDQQSPEGFYQVRLDQLNPHSRYHLAFDIGYPNLYDTIHGRQGSQIMIHGRCSSRGCFAMGDAAMEEIYCLVQAALQQGQRSVAVHIFPFVPSPANLKKFKRSFWSSFWQSQQPMYDFFESNRQVPQVSVIQGSYTLDQPPPAHLSQLGQHIPKEQQPWLTNAEAPDESTSSAPPMSTAKPSAR
ncbi:L,D-transpeptidase family protein [Desulfogranum mediterraneum]|uniref:L,D-transpeptidase family protein n=1 Tax=Desulfogranum mediterraneum TaxID=160661 RepID=UPI0003FECEBC|nr:murein L,D-transpeptidase family protein [Desulfogranum mediterraneum]